VNRHDGNSAARFLQTPPKGIGAATLEELRAEPRAAGLKISDLLDLAALESGDPFRVLLDKLDQGDVVVFDLETTGLNRALDEIVEVAATRCGRDGAIESFHAFLRPTRPVGDSERIHHFSDEFLARNGRDPAQALEEFRTFCGDSALCGHNVFAFDLPMLVAQMNRLDMHPLASSAVFDTLDLTRRLYRLPRYALSQIAKSLQLKTIPSHKADDDVATTVELLLLLCAKICNGSAIRRAAIQRHAKKFLPCAEKLAAWKERSLVERPHELLGRVLEESGLAEYYQGQDDSIPRIQHLKELVRLFESHDDPALEPTDSLVNLLNMASLGADIDRHLGGEDRVLLLTVHQAKGLEFDTVFIAGATDNEFPSFRSKREGRLDEEHRLFYVAISRAKKRLFLSYPGLDSRGRETIRSRYLGMLPESVVERR
jgi:DNA helicase-2/ATP-dependent DNA helicase PcrA